MSTTRIKDSAYLEEDTAYSITETVLDEPKNYAELREEADVEWGAFFTVLNSLRDREVVEAKNQEYEPYTHFGITEYGEQVLEEKEGMNL